MKYIWLLVLLLSPAWARDDGRWADSPLKPWFDTLKNQSRGMCCSFADGQRIDDVDWDTQNGKYRVRIEGQWYDVPDWAVVTVPNKAGFAVVWPYVEWDEGGNKHYKIRCFMPGSGS